MDKTILIAIYDWPDVLQTSWQLNSGGFVTDDDMLRLVALAEQAAAQLQEFEHWQDDCLATHEAAKTIRQYIKGKPGFASRQAG